MLKVKILIVEDDEAIANLININLSMAGYDSKKVFDGEEALKLIREEKFDLILLDIMLPGLDGFEILDRIRNLNIPVIFLTAKNGLADKVTGLRKGAEDYIVKPFESLELLARIEVVLRRFSKNNNCIDFKDLKIYEDERVVKKDGQAIELTLKEFELLLNLVKNKNRALSREYLLEKIWGYEYMGETRTVDTHIQKIRRKLNLADNIKTVYKIGYRLEE